MRVRSHFCLRNSQFRAPTEPSVVPLPCRELAEDRAEEKPSEDRRWTLRHPLHDLSARSRRTQRTKTERDSVASTWSRSPGEELKCLKDERLVNTVARIDSTARAEQALDAACEDPAFRDFTEKILNSWKRLHRRRGELLPLSSEIALKRRVMMFKALETRRSRGSARRGARAELKDKAKQRFNDASEKGRKLRENVEVFTGVDKARESFAQAVNPVGGSSTAARLGAFSGAALDAEALRETFAKIGSEPYELVDDDLEDSDASRRETTEAGPRGRRCQGEPAGGSGCHRCGGNRQDPSRRLFLPEGDFDPLRYVLEVYQADQDITVDVLHKQEERLSNQVEAVSTKIAKDVNEHYEDFVQGMRNITELTDGLEQSFVIVNNGRRNISFARESVGRAMRVAESHTRKKSLMAALDMLVRVRECQSLEARIRSSLEASCFVDAVVEYAQAMNILKSLDGLTCAETLGQDLRALLWDLMNSVEAVLFKVCGDFKPEEYSPLFDAYMQFGSEVKPLGDKVQELFLRSVERQTEGMLRLHSMTRAGVTENDDAAAAVRLGCHIKSFANQLSPTQFFPCFQKTLEVLFALLTSHHRMLRWHEEQIEAMENKGDDAGENQARVEVYEAVIGALVRSRRAIADMAGRALLLFCRRPPLRHLDNSKQSWIGLRLSSRPRKRFAVRKLRHCEAISNVLVIATFNSCTCRA